MGERCAKEPGSMRGVDLESIMHSCPTLRPDPKEEEEEEGRSG